MKFKPPGKNCWWLGLRKRKRKGGNYEDTLKIELTGRGDELDVENKVGHKKDECLVSGMSHWVEGSTICHKEKWGNTFD